MGSPTNSACGSNCERTGRAGPRRGAAKVEIAELDAFVEEALSTSHTAPEQDGQRPADPGWAYWIEWCRDEELDPEQAADDDDAVAYFIDEHDDPEDSVAVRALAALEARRERQSD